MPLTKYKVISKSWKKVGFTDSLLAADFVDIPACPAKRGNIENDISYIMRKAAGYGRRTAGNTEMAASRTNPARQPFL